MRVRSSLNLLLRQVSLVLVVDSQFLQALELSFLDAFNLDTLVFELLPDLAALLERGPADSFLPRLLLLVGGLRLDGGRGAHDTARRASRRAQP